MELEITALQVHPDTNPPKLYVTREDGTTVGVSLTKKERDELIELGVGTGS